MTEQDPTNGTAGLLARSATILRRVRNGALIGLTATALAMTIAAPSASAATVTATAPTHSTITTANVTDATILTVMAPSAAHVSADRFVGATFARASSNPWDRTWSKTWAFAQCIAGVGVPIGVAIGIAITPATWAWLAGVGPLPASAGGTVARYAGWIKTNCRYALFQ